MKEIPVTGGYVALVDDEDYDRVSAHRWRYDAGRHTMYAKSEINGKTMGMHYFITGRKFTDHRDGNGLNNQKANLRKANRSLQRANSVHNHELPRGVSKKKDRNKWQAQIRVRGKLKYLGAFDSVEEAAAAYDKEARKHFGEFATLNDHSLRS